MIEIQNAFSIKLNSINPTIATAYENVPFDPKLLPVGSPYQELSLLPSYNDSEYINDKQYISYGLVQITLKYPTTKGSKDILDRVKLYMNNFVRGDTLTNGEISIKIRSTPVAVNLGTIGDRYVYAISINYKAFYEMV